MKKRLTVTPLALLLLLTGCSSARVENLKSLALDDYLSAYEIYDDYKASLNYARQIERTHDVYETQLEFQEVSSEVVEIVKQYIANVEQALSGSVGTDLVSEELLTYFKYITDDKALTQSDLQVQEAQGHYFVDVTYNFTPTTTGTFGDSARYMGIYGAFVSDADGNVYLDSDFIKQTEMQASKVTTTRPVASYEGVRYPQIDITSYNNAIGNMLTTIPATPKVSQVYNIPNNSLGGYCFYPNGSLSLKEFGLSRENYTGELTIRYVFKKDLVDKTHLTLTNLYMTNLTTTGDLGISDNPTVIVPDFVQQEAENLVERFDRVIMNGDISGLMNGLIFEDIGMAAKHILLGNNIDKQTNITTVEIVDRNQDTNMYLLKFSAIRQDSPNGLLSLGVYTDSGYMVMQQNAQDSSFRLTDYIITESTVEREPNLITDSVIQKRLVSLGLAGEVADKDKSAIKETLAEFYQSGTERKLSGVDSMFNSNTDLLSSQRKNYLVNQLQKWLTLYGASVPTTYIGTVTEFIGGTEEQVELISNEMMVYEGKNFGIVMDVYYLMSKFEDKWVIDEKTVLTSKELTGEELVQARASVENGTGYLIENPDNSLIQTVVAEEETEE